MIYEIRYIVIFDEWRGPMCKLIKGLVRFGLDLVFGPEEQFDYLDPTSPMPYHKRTHIEDVY